MRLPSTKQSILLIGQNGSGKTVAAIWHLSQKDFDNEIWIALNHKNEESIDSIPGAQSVKMNFFPKKPGLYIYHPIPDVDDEAVTALMWKIYEHTHIGLYIDEGYMINPRDHALTALYTQGRSKHIPIITLSQRPSKISRFAVSEAQFIQVFHLTDKRDRETVNAFIPANLEKLMHAEAGQDRLLPKFHSVYYDVGANKLNIMGPVPEEKFVIGTFADKLLLPKTKNRLI